MERRISGVKIRPLLHDNTTALIPFFLKAEKRETCSSVALYSEHETCEGPFSHDIR
jgi:hypothetical protein